MPVGCPVRGCGQGSCLVDACNPGPVVDVLDLVWNDDFGLCAEMSPPPAPVTCGCGERVRSESDLSAHWDECGGGR
jgi:hypothetical protein